MCKAVSMDCATYMLLYHLLLAQGYTLADCNITPSIPGIPILINVALPQRHMKIGKSALAVALEHAGNASIVHTDQDGMHLSGDISSIWVKEIEGIACTFLVVAPHKSLSEPDVELNPWSSRPGF
jgi:hypothetical protein